MFLKEVAEEFIKVIEVIEVIKKIVEEEFKILIFKIIIKEEFR